MPKKKVVRKPKKATKVAKIEVVEPKLAGLPELPEVVEAQLPLIESNTRVSVVELNGRKYNQVFNPADGTTKLLPL